MSENEQNIYDTVKSYLKQNGGTATAAAKAVGIQPQRYFDAVSKKRRLQGKTRAYKPRKVKTKRTRARLINIPVAETVKTQSRVMVLVGFPADVQETIKGLSF